MRALRCDAGGHPVELVDHREIGSGSDPLAFSATAFATVDFKERDNVRPGHFLVSAVRGPTEEIVRQHLGQSGEGKSFAHVFPELTIDHSMRGIIADELLALEAGAGRGPVIVVGGSFHDEVGTGFANRGVVYSRVGKELFDFQKVVAYFDKSKQCEDIVASRSIKVMVTAIGLIAFPICKDLCHSYDTPFSQLDVDFLLTPSCGDDVTMSEHKGAAARLHDRFGCRSFVAQQSYPKRSDDVIGFVLPATSTVRKLADSATFIQEPFSICAVS
ncbi:hypothetical protein QO058_20490 [Bosea vestrisii]|uniref:hypothetical protein n=1 Tax=Bosea vestrisii TaxID=151416 RepID=UPI0024DFDBDA|nr:hypothetical protein [Bosea vestrisii]WID95160.1 hypothetical protein QO058_20490 [Bosea vestrisii]